MDYPSHVSHVKSLEDYSALFPSDAFSLFGDDSFNFDTSHWDFESVSNQDDHNPDLDPFGLINYEAGQSLPDVSFSTTSYGSDCNGCQTAPPKASIKPQPGQQEILPTGTSHLSIPRRRIHQDHLIGDESASLKTTTFKWEDSMVVFPVQPNAKVALRKRRRFDRSRRKEVALNRLVGACIHCRLRKGSCSFGLPCSDCVKRAGSISLGQQLCTRQSLLNARFNNVDLMGVIVFDQILEQHEEPFIVGTRREMSIEWPNCCHNSRNIPLKLQVQDIKPFRHLRFNHGDTQTIRHWGYDSYYDIRAPDSYCALIPNLMPSIEALYGCCLDSSHCCDGGPFKPLHIAFAIFGERYCNLDEKLPLQGLLRKAIQMKRLLGLYGWAPLYKKTPEDSKLLYVPSWIKLQLRNHLGKGIMALEAEILDELDHLISASEGLGRRNPVATWVCLWFLILAYRAHIGFIYIYFREDDSFREPRFALGKHIYNSLVSIYCALYKTTSPLTLDYCKKEIRQLLGHDELLVESLKNIKLEMFQLHADRDWLFPEDALFKALILERERDLLTSHEKSDKCKSIYETQICLKEGTKAARSSFGRIS